ncbi:hypothetical protein M2346_000393 [Sphingobium xanthum]|nr:hypothetical protein [Sphingobium sp. B10D3B]MCW2400374.1 hypothetical protein [Sphingobium sp. B10D7B]MCW2407352.1 hypothetical protein [Sphingobium xanthum]
MDQLAREKLLLLAHDPLIVNIRAGAEPAHDVAGIIPDRQCAPERPAIFAIEPAQAIFDFIGIAGG